MGLDLCGQDPQPMLDFAVDPVTVLEVCYALYQDYFEKEKISQDDFEDLCGPEEIEAFRKEVVQQMESFSSFWKILSTQMEGLLSGNISLLDLSRAAQGQDPSGPSS